MARVDIRQAMYRLICFYQVVPLPLLKALLFTGSTAFSLDQNTWLSLGQALDHLVQFWFSITDVRVGICTDPILRDGIKCAVVTQAGEIKKVHEVPCLGADGYKSALKYVYESVF